MRVAGFVLALVLVGCGDDSETSVDGSVTPLDAARDSGASGDVDAGPTGEPARLAGILAAHNAVRAAHGVPPLTWSSSLAATAQAWVETCTDEEAPIGLVDHNAGRSTGHPSYVGENIYGSANTVGGSHAVDLWAAEEADYDYDTNTCSGTCGHYTQLVWRASTEVGCAIHTCAGFAYGNTIVCNYMPGGNSGGGRPY